MDTMSRLHLILAFHNHQPVGNFDHVLEEAYEKSYLPFLETLLRFPRLKVVLHYSGFLLSWMQKRHPEAIEIIRSLVKAKRAEILSGGFYEPILSVLPERDRHSQITGMNQYLRKQLGYTPRGMWLAERVWEPQMPKCISAAGIDYISLDDYHFKLTGLEEGDLLGYYVTEEEGHTLSIFPGSELLRYLIPFRSVDEVISYFREISMRGGNPLLTMADDGEKFGVWPNTHKHCYEDGWLDSFLSALEKNSDWIETTTFSEYHTRFLPAGRVYLPTASYREMGEWTLPSEAGIEYEHILGELEKLVGARAKQFLRGGIWRSFMVKYPESNHIQKRMTMISGKVLEAIGKDGRRGKEAERELWMGQCNDAYWHGVFGGLYLPHLRSALFRHLIRAETLAEEVLGKDTVLDQADFDCDGFDDIVLSTRNLTLVATECNGSLTELSLKKQSVNVLDILSRRPEGYHAKIVKASENASDTTKTIHEQLVVKEAGLHNYLIYDAYRRASLLDHFFPAGTKLEQVINAGHEELGDFIGKRYDLKHARKGKGTVIGLSADGMAGQGRMRIEKSVEVGKEGSLAVDYLLKGAFSGLFAVEMNFSLLGSPHAMICSGKQILSVRQPEAHAQVKRFSVEDKFLNLSLQFSFPEPVMLWHHPVETISLSEQGIERLYQGTAFLFVVPLDIKEKKKISFALHFGEAAS